MTWMLFEDDRRQYWMVDQEGLWLLCCQAVYAQMMYERMKVVPQERPWFWFGQDIRNVEFDFKDFHPTKIKRAQALYSDLTIASLKNAAAVFGQLAQMKDELDLFTRRVKGKQGEIARDNADAVEHNVGVFGRMAHGAKIVRDSSVTILLAGASLLSGGAAAAVLGTGSVLKGVAKYEDQVKLSDGNRALDAVLTAAGTFGVGLIPGGEGAKKYVLLAAGSAVNGFVDGGTSLIEGNGVRKSVISAAMSAGISMIPLGDKLKSMSVPVKVKLEREAAELAVSAAARKVETRTAKLAVQRAAHWSTKTAKKHLKEAVRTLRSANKLKASLAPKLTDPLTVEQAVALTASAVASVDGDLLKDKVVDSFGKAAKPAAGASASLIHVPSHQQHLIGVVTRLDEAVSSADYIRETALCPAS